MKATSTCSKARRKTVSSPMALKLICGRIQTPEIAVVGTVLTNRPAGVVQVASQGCFRYQAKTKKDLMRSLTTGFMRSSTSSKNLMLTTLRLCEIAFFTVTAHGCHRREDAGTHQLASWVLPDWAHSSSMAKIFNKCIVGNPDSHL